VAQDSGIPVSYLYMSDPTNGPLPCDLARAISKEEIADLPIGGYEGDICLVRTPDDLERAREDFSQEQFVGFDTETRPSFRKGDSHPPCLIQAATARTVYLFRLREPVDFQVPGELVASPGILKVGIGLADDIRALKALHVLEDRSMLDLGTIAKRCGLTQSGVRNLAGLFLKIRIPKSIKTSNWATPQLSTAQIRYAATDAWICRELFLRFRDLGMIPKAE
jgi:ribonuclease D